MTKLRTLVPIALLLALAACGKHNAKTAETVASQPSPSDRLVQLDEAYGQNALAAKREWGGRRLVIGGNVDTVGRSVDRHPDILLVAGPSRTMADLTFPNRYEAFTAGLQHDAYVEVECTVDPDYEGTRLGVNPIEMRLSG